jgi:ABC-type glycerol-3-phosphate transport system permease component
MASSLGSRKRRNPTLLIVLSIGAIAMLLPFYWMIISAFKPTREVMQFPPTLWPAEPTLEHWLTIFTEMRGGFHVFFMNSMFVTVTVTVFVLVTSSLGGYVFAKIRFPGREAIFVVVLSLLMVPFNVTLIPLYRLIVELGWHNTHWALIVPATVNPLGIFLMRQFMHDIPEEIIEAARVDGAREFTIWWRIVVPLTTPAIAALGIFIFLWTWDDFLWPLVALIDVELYTLPLGLSQLRGRFGADVGAGMAGATVAVMPVVVAFLFAQRRFVEGVTMTGIK